VTKTEIIQAAFRVWGRNFYRKTSLSQLAGELGVSKPALYRHFICKEALTAAMAEYFFADFAGSVSADFEKALGAEDADEGVFDIVQCIASYFARNGYALVFSLVNIYDRNLDGVTISQRIKERGADMSVLQKVIEKKYEANPSLLKLIFATLTFYMSNFHRVNDSLEKPLSDNEIKNIVSDLYKIAEQGLGFQIEKAGTLDFEKLEKQIEELELNSEPEPLLKAVAEAVAKAGPWDISMEMVAKRAGLSKSSLYGHFKDKKDMLRRLFIGEFKRIIDFARHGINLSADTAQQLYLGIYSIAVYLRSRPEILIAMSWIRTRKLDIGKPDDDLEIFRLFEDINIESLRNANEDEKQRVSHWILFLLINVLTRPYLSEEDRKKTFPVNVENSNLRMLYKFITMGLGGFKRCV
jgi:AcrR family transcriptional regulator